MRIDLQELGLLGCIHGVTREELLESCLTPEHRNDIDTIYTAHNNTLYVTCLMAYRNSLKDDSISVEVHYDTDNNNRICHIYSVDLTKLQRLFNKYNKTNKLETFTRWGRDAN